MIQGFIDHVAAQTDAHLVYGGPGGGGGGRRPRGQAEVLRRRAPCTRPDPRPECPGAPGRAADGRLQENAAIVNALQRRASVVVQKSIAEGFGLTVAEGMWKARPVVASRIGGIQDQDLFGGSRIGRHPAGGRSRLSRRSSQRQRGRVASAPICIARDVCRARKHSNHAHDAALGCLLALVFVQVVYGPLAAALVGAAAMAPELPPIRSLLGQRDEVDRAYARWAVWTSNRTMGGLGGLAAQAGWAPGRARASFSPRSWVSSPTSRSTAS